MVTTRALNPPGAKLVDRRAINRCESPSALRRVYSCTCGLPLTAWPDRIFSLCAWIASVQRLSRRSPLPYAF